MATKSRVNFFFCFQSQLAMCWSNWIYGETIEKKSEHHTTTEEYFHLLAHSSVNFLEIFRPFCRIGYTTQKKRKNAWNGNSGNIGFARTIWTNITRIQKKRQARKKYAPQKGHVEILHHFGFRFGKNKWWHFPWAFLFLVIEFWHHLWYLAALYFVDFQSHFATLISIIKIIFVIQYIPLIRLNSLYFPTYFISSCFLLFFSIFVCVCVCVLFKRNSIRIDAQLIIIFFFFVFLEIFHTNHDLRFKFQTQKWLQQYLQTHNKKNWLWRKQAIYTENVVFSTLLSFACFSSSLVFIFNLWLSLYLDCVYVVACHRALTSFAADFKANILNTPTIHQYGGQTYSLNKCTR